jgi:hypothetical protein
MLLWKQSGPKPARSEEKAPCKGVPEKSNSYAERWVKCDTIVRFLSLLTSQRERTSPSGFNLRHFVFNFKLCYRRISKRVFSSRDFTTAIAARHRCLGREPGNEREAPSKSGVRIAKWTSARNLPISLIRRNAMRASTFVGIFYAALAAGAAFFLVTGNHTSDTVAWMALGLAAAVFAILTSRVRPRRTRSW